MRELSISFVKDAKKTSVTNVHNNRELSDEEKKSDAYKHVDFSRTKDNISIRKESIDDAYQTCFGDAVDEYNAKQKRKKRKIDDYRLHIQRDEHKRGSLNVQREFLIQLGDQESFADDNERKEYADVLRQYAEEFIQRNENMYVCNAVIHMDEATPHLHLNVIPVADGYKNGVKKKPSFDRAIQQQYENKGEPVPTSKPYLKWREQEVALLEEKLNEKGVKRKIVGSNEYKDVNDYKQQKDFQAEAKKELFEELKPSALKAYKKTIRKNADEYKAKLKEDPEVRAEAVNELKEDPAILSELKTAINSTVVALDLRNENLKQKEQTVEAKRKKVAEREDRLNQLEEDMTTKNELLSRKEEYADNMGRIAENQTDIANSIIAGREPMRDELAKLPLETRHKKKVLSVVDKHTDPEKYKADQLKQTQKKRQQKEQQQRTKELEQQVKQQQQMNKGKSL